MKADELISLFLFQLCMYIPIQISPFGTAGFLLL